MSHVATTLAAIFLAAPENAVGIPSRRSAALKGDCRHECTGRGVETVLGGVTVRLGRLNRGVMPQGDRERIILGLGMPAGAPGYEDCAARCRRPV